MRQEKTVLITLPLNNFPNAEEILEELGESLANILSDKIIADWEIKNNTLHLSTRATQQASKLEKFIHEANTPGQQTQLDYRQL